MDAEAVLKHRVRNEQTSGEKKSPSKGVIIFKFFPARTQIFRQIGQTFGSRRERVKNKNCSPHQPNHYIKNAPAVVLYCDVHVKSLSRPILVN
jgi:hypothetical protein